MEFTDVSRRRRMVRNYIDMPVDPEAIDRIMDAALRTPSAGHSQGQAYVVVTDPQIRRDIAALGGEPAYVAQGFDPWISKAPVHVVICVSETLYRERYREPDKSPDGAEMEWPIPYWWVDAGAAMMAILLAAVNEGLAAGFLGSHSLETIEDLLGIPDHMRSIGIVTIGHAAPDRPSSSLKRGTRDRTETVHRNRWRGIRRTGP